MAKGDHHELLRTKRGELIKAWTRGVDFDAKAKAQVLNVASMPFVYRWIAVMPDVHWGLGATIGSVIPTDGAIMPAAVGVDIGCGMMAQRTSLCASDLPHDLAKLRKAIETAVPHGRTDNGGRNDRGAWGTLPPRVQEAWQGLRGGFEKIVAGHPALRRGNCENHLGTLGTGNHFIEVCLDEEERVWLMLHSGSRGVGNRIGTYFINAAKQLMKSKKVKLPDPNLAYLSEGTRLFDDYLAAARWAQEFARINRELMMEAVVEALRKVVGRHDFEISVPGVNCHHNYVVKEEHFGRAVWVTRKGAVRARKGDLGIIPGSMGARSFIVSGKGNRDSFDSCSHGAGRLMSRSEAKRVFTVAMHEQATAHVECRKDRDVLDETPAAYKPIEAVMAAQADLVEIEHTLRQIVCVKG